MVVGVVAIVSVSALGLGFFFISPSIPDESGFQFVRDVATSTPNRIFFQIRAEDTNISITFVDREDLLYSINVVPHSNSTEAGISFDLHDDSWGINFRTTRQELVNITLGTGCFYFINMIDISNLNTNIIYGNNAWLNGSALRYSSEDSNLTLRIQNDISVTDTPGFDIDITCDTFNLDIEVPEEWNAFVDFHDSNLTILEMTGWRALLGLYGYRTDLIFDGMPSIEIDVIAEEAFARLLA
ncbi:MAG: hypothetical protein ACW99G_01845 [Candidatus Thorarchaeota archaeon]